MEPSIEKVGFSLNRLSEEEERELAIEYQRTQSSLALKKLRRSLNPMVEDLINRNTPSNDETMKSNLRVEAQGLLKDYILEYDPNQSVKLSTFIYSKLKWRLQNETASSQSGAYVPRNQSPNLKDYRAARREAELKYGRNPSEDQVEEFYPENTFNSFDKIKKYYTRNLRSDKKFKDDPEGDAVSFKDQFTGDYGITQDFMQSVDQRDRIEDQFNQGDFTDVEKRVISAVEIDGRSFIDVSLSEGLTTAEVRKIMRRWKNQ